MAKQTIGALNAHPARPRFLLVGVEQLSSNRGGFLHDDRDRDDAAIRQSDLQPIRLPSGQEFHDFRVRRLPLLPDSHQHRARQIEGQFHGGRVVQQLAVRRKTEEREITTQTALMCQHDPRHAAKVIIRRGRGSPGVEKLINLLRHREGFLLPCRRRFVTQVGKKSVVALELFLREGAIRPHRRQAFGRSRQEFVARQGHKRKSTDRPAEQITTRGVHFDPGEF